VDRRQPGRDPFGHEVRPPVDPVEAVHRYALRQTFEAADLGAELGAGVYVMWGGREGMECEAAKDVSVALEPTPNEPRGDMLLLTVGHALAFIGELSRPEMVGLNPEFAHETMSGLAFSQAVAQTMWHGKLFHIDLNAQRIGRYDQDVRFGAEGIREAFYLVRLLEDAAWPGMRHFDAHPYRTEDTDGVWEFACGWMRTYLILKEKAERFRSDPDALVGAGRRHERLDQLVTELLLGVR
jgi:xylose isomerase